MSGVLGIVPRMLAVNGGVYVSGAKLFVYNDGTTTKRAIYTTSALSVEHSNPLVADANGRFAGFYIDPDDGAYKLVLAPSADIDPPASPLWTEDVLPVPGASIIEGSFTGTITGVDAVVTGTISYRITANAAGAGKLCVLYNATGSNIVGTSNTTAMTLTGVPAACSPNASIQDTCAVFDNTTSVVARATVAASATTIAFEVDQPYSATGFTNGGSKGLGAGWKISYPL